MMAMQPMEVLGTLTATGLAVSLTPDLGLKVSPARLLTPELRVLIQAHKPALVECLQRQAVDEQAEAEREMYVERAAIMEFNGELDNDQAQQMARLHSQYMLHHWRCPICCAAGQGRGNRCTSGAPLWDSYQGAEAAISVKDSAKTDRVSLIVGSRNENHITQLCR